MTYRKQNGIKWLRYGREMSHIAWGEVGTEERNALEKIAKTAYQGDLDQAKRALNDYAVMRHRNRKKARRDAETDVRRRILVGARLPREKGEEVRSAALATGRSIYRFVSDAIDREVKRCMNMQADE